LGLPPFRTWGKLCKFIDQPSPFIWLLRENPYHPLLQTCPAVVQLVQVRYPSLIENLVPIILPYQIMAQNWKKGGNGDLAKGLYYIVPCLAQAEAVQGLLSKGGVLAGAIPLVDLYNPLKVVVLRKKEVPDNSPWPETIISGMKWAIAGGESKEIGLPATLIVDGIHHVARILELAREERLAG
jgi:hypothetical protein